MTCLEIHLQVRKWLDCMAMHVEASLKTLGSAPFKSEPSLCINKFRLESSVFPAAKVVEMEVSQFEVSEGARSGGVVSNENKIG